jgi:hypothetical protein
MSRYSVGVIKNPRSIDLYLAAKTKWTAIKQSILPYTVEPLLVWLDAVDPAHDQEDHQQQSLQQLLGDDSPCEDLDPQRWCHRHHHPNRDYLAAGAVVAAGAAAFVSALAGALSSLLAGLATSCLSCLVTASTLGVATGAVAAGAAAGALAGSAAKAVTANRPAIRVAIVFILNFLLG